jgi:hypothetical protein
LSLIWLHRNTATYYLTIREELRSLAWETHASLLIEWAKSCGFVPQRDPVSLRNEAVEAEQWLASVMFQEQHSPPPTSTHLKRRVDDTNAPLAKRVARES